MLFDILFWIIIVISSTFTMFWILVYIFRYLTPVTSTTHKINEPLPYVTIVVPAYNEEKTIEGTLTSLINLSYPKDKYEIIVINDGSKDKTPEKVKEFIKKHKNVVIKLISHKVNKGKGKSLNRGLKIARGEFFVVMDADTQTSKESLKRMISMFSSPSVGAVISHIKVKSSKTLLEKFQRFEYIYTQFMRNLMSTIGLLYITPGAFSVYRTSLLKKIGGFDEHTLTEDFEIALRIKYHNYEILFDEKSLTYTHIPQTFGAYLKQRLRWNLGFIENSRKYLWKFLKHKDFSLFGHIFYPLTLLSLVILIIYTLRNIYNFIDYVLYKIKVWIYSKKIVLFDYNNLREFLLSLNYDIYIPLIAIIIIALLTYLLAFKHAEEEIKDKVSFIVYFIIYTFITLGIWIFSLLYYTLLYKKKQRKWFR